MKARKGLYPVMMLLIASTSMAQTPTSPPAATAQAPAANTEQKVKIGGFIEYRAFYDDYRSVEASDGLSYYYPAAAIIDSTGKDINEKKQLQMISFCSRLNTKIEGPDAFGAKTKGVIEADFTGSATDLASAFKLRHAYFSFDWEKLQIIAGQYWHPTNIPECSPNTQAFGAGVPFHALLRSPQLRLTYAVMEQVKITGAFLMNNAFKVTDYNEAQRNSGIPEVALQAQFSNDQIFAALTGTYKEIEPRFATDKKAATTQSLGSFVYQASFKLKLEPITISLEGIYGENMMYLSMIGGYGAKQPTTVDDYKYSNLKTLSTWTDIETNGKNVKFGIFGGYSKNLGSDELYYSIKKANRNDDLAYIYRISPRVVFISGKVNVGLEYMLTTAVYGAKFDENRKVTEEADPVSDNRLLLNIKYSF